MNSRDYWQKRSEDRFLKQKTLAQSFERARREIQSQIDAFYGRYARNNAVSLSETQKALSLAELRDFKDDLAAFRKLALDSMSTFNLELENLSAQARVARLQALKCRMDAVVERLYISQRELIGGTAVEVYSDQYHRTLFDVDQYTGFHTEFAQINGAAVKRLLDYPFDGLMFSTRLWRQSEDLKPQIQQLVNRMFVTGKPPQDFADELAARSRRRRHTACSTRRGRSWRNRRHSTLTGKTKSAGISIPRRWTPKPARPAASWTAKSLR